MANYESLTLPKCDLCMKNPGPNGKGLCWEYHDESSEAAGKSTRRFFARDNGEFQENYFSGSIETCQIRINMKNNPNISQSTQ